jgi:hypothetical protein
MNDKQKIDILTSSLRGLFKWVMAEAEYFDAHTPDDDMLENIKSAITIGENSIKGN